MLSKDRLLPVFLAWFIGLWVTLFLATSGVSLPIGISIFTIQSIAFGILLGFIMLNMDENDGLKALKIVLLVTLITGYIGYSDFYSFSENFGLQLVLLFSLHSYFTPSIIIYYNNNCIILTCFLFTNIKKKKNPYKGTTTQAIHRRGKSHKIRA